MADTLRYRIRRCLHRQRVTLLTLALVTALGAVLSPPGGRGAHAQTPAPAQGDAQGATAPAAEAPAAPQMMADSLWEQVYYGRWEGREALLYSGSLFFGKLAFGDLDGDGDTDLLVGKQDGRVARFENKGRDDAPVWRLVEESIRVIRARKEGDTGPGTEPLDVGGHAAPALVDIDQDGDLDLFVGTADGRLVFLRNIGNQVLAAFQPVSANFLGRGFGAYVVPAFADVDDNRAPDLLVGNQAGDVYLLVNQGTQRRAAFCVQFPSPDALPTEDPPCRPTPRRLVSIAPENNAAPAMVDWNQDGSLDLFVGKSDGSLSYYENKGRPKEPDWRLEQQRFLAIDDGGFAAPAFLDVNGDGKPDIAVGGSTNHVALYTGKEARGPLDVYKVDGNLLGVRRVGQGLRQIVIASGDLDGDKDLDLMVGDRSGRLVWLENTGTPQAPAWRVKQDHLLAGALREDLAPWLVDLDGDGDLDLLVGGQDGRIWLMRNVGSAREAQFSLETTNFAGVDVGNDSVPVTVDVDRDGDPDLFVGNRRGVVVFYRNEGTPAAPDFRIASTRFGGATVNLGASPAFFDWNADGRPDLAVGSRRGGVLLDVNENPADNKELTAWKVEANPWPVFGVVPYSAPHFADLNGDGRMDALLGDADGNLRLWFNRGQRPPENGAAEQTVAASGDDSGPNAATTAALPPPASATAAAPLPQNRFQSQSGLLAPPEGAPADLQGGGGTAGMLLAEPLPSGPLEPIYKRVSDKYGDLAFKGRVRPAVGDLNGDGLIDLVVGTQDGRLVYLVNEGDRQKPRWVERIPNVGEFSNGRGPSPLLHDLDGDGLLDLIVGTERGQVRFFRNTGSKNEPAFTLVEDALAAVSVGRNAAPAVGRVNADEATDLIVGDISGQLWAYVREGGAQSLNFKLVDRRFLGVDVGVGSTPFVGDIDRDEKPDLLVGSDQGRVSLFVPAKVSKEHPQGWAPGPDYFKDIKFPFGTSPRLVDMDGDGDMDLLLGTEKGVLYYFRNDALGGEPGGSF